MVFLVNPVILLVKDPVPVPSAVLESDSDGLEDVDQHTPRAVTEVPPSLDTLPPETAAISVIPDVSFVVTEAKSFFRQRTDNPRTL